MKCCICGTVKNVEKYLDKIFSNIEKIGSLFEKYIIIFYYDHSTDNTLQKMKDYQQKVGPDKFIFYVNFTEVSKHRTIRIAHGRNKCLNIIRQCYINYPYFIMIDCDDKCSEDVKLNILQPYLLRNDWDSLSFNKTNYYDIWALSITPYIVSFIHFNPRPFNSMQKYINKQLKELPKGQLLKCHSAFNGFAIYRTNKFINCRYDGRIRLDLIPKHILTTNINICKSLINNEPIDCEHRSFHLEAIKKNNARIRISSEIIF